MAGGKAGISIGIDLGTTYCCVGGFLGNHVTIMPDLDDGKHKIPSYIAFKDNEFVIGARAKEQDDENTVFDFKRLIGLEFTDKYVQSDMEWLPFKIENSDAGIPVILVEFEGKQQRYTAEEITYFMLTRLKNFAEEHFNSRINNAVITVPRYFNKAQREATKRAGEKCGLTISAILDECTAAAVNYAINNQLMSSSLKDVLVFNLGGGTLEVSVLTIGEGIIRVKASAGDTHLGGDDFVTSMVIHCVDEFNEKQGVDIRKDIRAIWRLRKACEKAKRKLSSSLDTTVDIDSLSPGKDFRETFDRALFERVNKGLFDKCRELLEKCLTESRTDKMNIQDVILVGGSTRIPKVQLLIKEFLNVKSICPTIDKNEAVAYGATVVASCLSHEGNEMYNEMKVLDNPPIDFMSETRSPPAFSQLDEQPLSAHKAHKAQRKQPDFVEGSLSHNGQQTLFDMYSDPRTVPSRPRMADSNLSLLTRMCDLIELIIESFIQNDYERLEKLVSDYQTVKKRLEILGKLKLLKIAGGFEAQRFEENIKAQDEKVYQVTYMPPDAVAIECQKLEQKIRNYKTKTELYVARDSNTGFSKTLNRWVMYKKKSKICTDSDWRKKASHLLKTVIPPLCSSGNDELMRTVFYKGKALGLFTDQSQSNLLIQDIASMLRIHRPCLRLKASSTRLVTGRLKYEIGDEWIDCNKQVVMPNDLAIYEITEMVSDAYLILLVEKEGIYDKLIKHDFHNLYPSIIVYSRGHPDHATKRFLQKLVLKTRLLVFGVTDGDIGGYDINAVDLFGSKKVAFDSASLVIPIHWIALLPSDPEFSLPLVRPSDSSDPEFSEVDVEPKRESVLSANDRKKVLNRIAFLRNSSREHWALELEILLEKGYTVGLDSLSQLGLGEDYVIEYLLRKILEFPTETLDYQSQDIHKASSLEEKKKKALGGYQVRCILKDSLIKKKKKKGPSFRQRKKKASGEFEDVRKALEDFQLGDIQKASRDVLPEESVMVGDSELGDQQFPDSQRYVGLLNPSNICFCNCIIQALYHCVPARENLKALSKNLKPDGEENMVTCLSKLFVEMSSSRYAIYPKHFVGKVRSQNLQFRPDEHQDAQEVMTVLLDELVVYPPSSELMKRYFQGKTSQKTKCDNGHESVVPDVFRNLMLGIGPHTSLMSCLKRHCSSERMIGENLYFCDQCDSNVGALKTLTITEAPEFLTISLKRFAIEKEEFKKLTWRVSYPLDLDLGDIGNGGDNSKYSLLAVVVHHGSGEVHGHYVTLVKSHNQWLKFDDAKVTSIDSSVVKSFYGTRGSDAQAYILIYKKETHEA